MKLVLPLFVIASAAASFSDVDEGLALLQVGSVAKHTGRGGGGKTPVKEEAEEAQRQSREAVNVAKQAVAESEKAEKDANAAKAKASIPTAPVMEDEAAATGDPHLKQANHAHKELCCTGSVCKACPEALVQQKEDMEEIKNDKGTKHKGRGSGGKTPVVEAEEAQREAKSAVNLAKEALAEAQKAQSDANKASEDADKEEVEEQAASIDDEAAATGDPHLTQAYGARKDLCCSGSICKPCPHSALVQQKHKARGAGEKPAIEEALEAEEEASGALTKAREALREARKADGDAKKASEDADKEDQAAATGDPHLTQTHGDKQDLCCHGGHCKPC